MIWTFSPDLNHVPGTGRCVPGKPWPPVPGNGKCCLRVRSGQPQSSTCQVNKYQPLPTGAGSSTGCLERLCKESSLLGTIQESHPCFFCEVVNHFTFIIFLVLDIVLRTSHGSFFKLHKNHMKYIESHFIDKGMAVQEL